VRSQRRKLQGQAALNDKYKKKGDHENKLGGMPRTNPKKKKKKKKKSQMVTSARKKNYHKNKKFQVTNFMLFLFSYQKK